MDALDQTLNSGRDSGPRPTAGCRQPLTGLCGCDGCPLFRSRSPPETRTREPCTARHTLSRGVLMQKIGKRGNRQLSRPLPPRALVWCCSESPPPSGVLRFGCWWLVRGLGSWSQVLHPSRRTSCHITEHSEVSFDVNSSELHLKAGTTRLSLCMEPTRHDRSTRA